MNLVFRQQMAETGEIMLFLKTMKICTVSGKLPCRHIHSINKMKDGYVVETGEIHYLKTILEYFRMV